MRLLIVEDDEMLGSALQRTLARAGYTVDWFMRGDDGLPATEAQTYDTVVRDLGIPVLDGIWSAP